MFDDLVVMSEHPAWTVTGQVIRRALAGPDGERWIATVSGRRLTVEALAGTTTTLRADAFALPDQAASDVPELAVALEALGRVARVGNPDLWDAVAIVRQVIQIGRAHV